MRTINLSNYGENAIFYPVPGTQFLGTTGYFRSNENDQSVRGVHATNAALSQLVSTIPTSGIKVIKMVVDCGTGELLTVNEYGLCFVSLTQTGFSAFLSASTLVIRKESSGSPSAILHSSSGYPDSGQIEMWLEFDYDTGDISVSIDTVEVATANYDEEYTDLYGGLQLYDPIVSTGFPTSHPSVLSITVEGTSENLVPPITIQAESYSDMFGIQLEASADVGGTFNVGYVDIYDYFEYENFPIVISASGNYKFTYRIASNDGSIGSLELQNILDSNAVLDTVATPFTSGWQAWEDVERTIYLDAGTYQFRIQSVSAVSFNINYFKIESVGGEAPVVGDIATTFDDVVSTIDGSLLVAGNIASSLENTTVDIIGGLTVNGDLATTLSGASVSISSFLTVSCDLSASFSGVTVDLNGSLLVSGNIGSSLSGVSSGISGSLSVNGNISSVLDGVTVLFVGGSVVGSIATTFDGAVFAGQMSLTVAGDLNSSFSGASVSFAGGLGVAGNLSSSLAGAVVALEGSLVVEGAISSILAGVQVEILGEIIAPTPVEGHISVTFQNLTCSIHGNVGGALIIVPDLKRILMVEPEIRKLIV